MYMKKLLSYIFLPVAFLLNGLLYLMALPLCCLIASFDRSNGRGFKNNLRTVMGLDFKKDKEDSQG